MMSMLMCLQLPHGNLHADNLPLMVPRTIGSQFSRIYPSIASLFFFLTAMLATIGFLVGEKVEGSSFLFDASISGPAISHIPQVPAEFWVALIASIGAAEQFRAEKGWVNPSDTPVDAPGQLLADYTPGDLGFDPLGLMPEDPEEFFEMQTKELQNGRLAMLAAAGFLAQEAVDGKGILEHFSS